MKTRFYTLGIILSALLFLAASTWGQSEPKINTKDVMKFKLLHAQRVLEGIAMENYEVIADNAKKLKGLSGQAEWQIRQTPEYQRLTADFVRTTESLIKAAENKNVDAATVAYFQMTVSCTTCHKYLRGEKGFGLNRNEKSNTARISPKKELATH